MTEDSSQPLELRPGWIQLRVDGTLVYGEGVPNLQMLQSMVGGYIEGAPTPLPVRIFCNEEGKLEGLPHNMIASLLCSDSIVGHVVICGREDEQGELTPLDDEMGAFVLRVIRRAKEFLRGGSPW